MHGVTVRKREKCVGMGGVWNYQAETGYPQGSRKPVWIPASVKGEITPSLMYCLESSISCELDTCREVVQ